MVNVSLQQEEDMSSSLVLLHGWGLNSAVWESIRPSLSQRFKLHALNIPGFGGEPWDETLADIECCADHLAAYISRHCQPPVSLLGWSMGGLLATTIALRHPHLVARLYTLASSPCFLAKPEQRWPGIAADVLKQFQRQLEDDFALTVKRFLAVQAMGSPTARDDIKQLQKKVLELPMAHPGALKAGLNWLAEVDLRAQLSSLAMPLQRGYGRLDSLVPVAINQQISEGGSSVFERSAHTPFLNQAEDFSEWICQ